MPFISGSASESPHRSTQDQSSPHLTHTASDSLSTQPLSKACPQPLHSGSRLSPRLLRRRISHNISSLVNKFESTSTNTPTTVLPTKTPSYQIVHLQVPPELNDQGDGLYVRKQTRNATCRTSSTADTSEKYVGSENQFYSSDDQVILETTTFMSGWNMSKRMEQRCEMRSNSTNERSSETLRGSQRYPPPTLLNKVSRSSVSPSDCIASARGRLNGAMKEKVRLFDEGKWSPHFTKSRVVLTSLLRSHVYGKERQDRVVINILNANKSVSRKLQEHQPSVFGDLNKGFGTDYDAHKEFRPRSTDARFPGSHSWPALNETYTKVV